MSFFKELKEDLSQAVNELVTDDELLGDEYVDTLDDELLGLDEVKKEKKDAITSNEKEPNLLENDLQQQLEEDTFVDTLDNELSSTLETKKISEPKHSDLGLDVNTKEVLSSEEKEALSFVFDENSMDDDLSDLVKEFEDQIMTEESKMSSESDTTSSEESSSEEEEIEETILEESSEDTTLEESILEETLEEPILEEMPEETILEEPILEEMPEETILEEPILEEMPEETILEEPILEETILEELSEEPLLPEEKEDSLLIQEENLEDKRNDITEDTTTANDETVDEDTMDLLNILENEIQDMEIEQSPEEPVDEVELQEELEEPISIDFVSDKIEEEFAKEDSVIEEVELETASDNITEGEEEIEQQMEDEIMSELDGVLEQTDNLEDENVDMDLIAQMLGEEEETPLVVPDEITDMEEETDETISLDEPFLEEEVEMEAAEETPAKTANVNDVTVISKGTRIEGNIISDSSLDVMGTVKGDIECLGKLSVTGHVEGNSSAAEIFVNTTRVEGDLISKGAVKVGAGTVILGDIAGTSAVVAGAVKGEIDVDGPIIVDSTAIVKGNIKAKSVQVNNGAVIDGYCSLAYAALDIDNFFDGESKE